MGHYLPVFFFPIKASEAAREFSSWNDGVPLIEQYYGENGDHLWVSHSHNWWHQLTLFNFAKALNLDGLDFIQSEISCLAPQQVATAEASLHSLLDLLPGAIFHPALEHDADLDRLRARGFRSAFFDAEALRQVDEPSVKVENCDAWSFFAFLKSLHAALTSAIRQREHLLYVRTQA
jgi:hypothetical protein